jgi:hypothetical protein
MRLAVFLVCSGIGYLMGQYLPDPVGAYVRVLVPYHLFLLYLVAMENEKAGLSMPLVQTIVTHTACLALLIGLGMGRRYVPFFGLISLFVPGLAPFEAEWLFSGGAKTEEKKAAPVVHVAAEESADEYAEFMKYMAGPKRQGRVQPVENREKLGAGNWERQIAQSRTTIRVYSLRLFGQGSRSNEHKPRS